MDLTYQLHTSVRLDYLTSGNKVPQKYTIPSVMDQYASLYLNLTFHLDATHHTEQNTPVNTDRISSVRMGHQETSVCCVFYYSLHESESTRCAALEQFDCLLREQRGALYLYFSLCVFQFNKNCPYLPYTRGNTFVFLIKLEKSFLLLEYSIIFRKMEMHWLCSESLGQQHQLKTRKKLRIENHIAGRKHVQINNWK